MQIRPDLAGSAMLLAYEGWNDAGEAASSALAFVNDAVRTVPLAEIDPEEFYDFTVRRPHVAVEECENGARRRQILWPVSEFRFGSIDEDRTVVVGIGIEPHLRWRSYCECVAEVAKTVGVTRVVILGSYLADVVYSQPVLVTGVASRPEGLAGIDIDGSPYEGPTGIVGVLADHLEHLGFEVVCLWAGLPHYITATPNPRGALALVQRLTATLGIQLNEQPLLEQAAEFEQHISQMVAADSELADYVKQLKKREFAQ
jgi:hypothetical protein